MSTTMRLRAAALTMALALAPAPAFAQAPATQARQSTTVRQPGGPFQVASPNRDIVVSLTTEGAQLAWSIAYRGAPLTRPSPLALVLEGGRVLGDKPLFTTTLSRGVDTTLTPPVRYRRAEIRDRFNESTFIFAGNYALVVRAYDDGVAYRWKATLPGEITVVSEEATLAFPADHAMLFPEEISLLSHQEREYKKLRISEITAGRFSSLPAMVIPATGPKMVFTEADLFDYPGMNLTAGTGANALKGLFPAFPKTVELNRDRNERVIEREPWIAKTKGTREFPWRVLAITDRDETLLDTDIVYRLASPTAIADTSWIRPGKVAWDWWNALNIYGVAFKSGVNTDTYTHYIDFAAENGLEYIILDEGWYKLGDLMSVTPGVDMEAIAAHAMAKKVGLIMWVVWKTLDLQMRPALDQFEKWGVKGIKVDFMQREDQWMVNYYERVAREAAKRKMLVDFHGAYKPTGLYRTWPNVVTSEGVLGLEQSKWGELASPDNAVTFPFMRMLAGPVDYTPGAMLNAAKKDFKPIFDRPMSQGTRCQQLAMYVVYESPLQMLADSPSNYRKEPESLEFLRAVPAVWDETRVLRAKVGEHILVARRSGREWYIGALTNWTARDLDIDLSFLGAGAFDADTYRDGPNADRAGVDYARVKARVTSSDRMRIHLAPGGGFAARIVPR